VSLTVSGPEDSDTIDKTDYISVAAPAVGGTVIVPDDHTTVQAAVTAVENDADPGEVIINSDGPFDETVLIQQSVTIKAGDECSPVIERTSGWQAPIRISATQDSDTVVVLQGITVRTDASGDFDGITISNNSSSNTLEVIIDNVTVDAKESQSAVSVASASINADISLTITNSFIQIEGEAAGSPECVRLDPYGYSITAVFRNNTFRFSGAGGISIEGGRDDKLITTTMDANLFEGFSSASGEGRRGIDISGTGTPGSLASPTNTTITNNLFLRTGLAIEVNGQQQHTHTASINNNTIVDSSWDGMDLVAFGDSTLIVSVYNNIITGTSNGWGGYGIYRYEASNGVVNLTNDYNLLFDNESGNYSGVTAGPHVLAVDPQFMDPGTDNYRLQASSPAIDSGVNSPPGGLGAERDLDGSARVQDGDGNGTTLCDRGAYEKGSIVLTIPLTATEGDGILENEGTVTISDTLDSALVVSLVCSDTSEVTVPATVTVPAGHTEASFDLTIVDDSEIDGTQTVTVTGSAAGWASGSSTIEVEDDELGGGGNGGCFIATAGS